MKLILGYYVVPPGELWIRFADGEMQQTTCDVDDAAAPGSLPMDWHDPRCQQPQTGSARRFAGSQPGQYP